MNEFEFLLFLGVVAEKIIVVKHEVILLETILMILKIHMLFPVISAQRRLSRIIAAVSRGLLYLTKDRRGHTSIILLLLSCLIK